MTLPLFAVAPNRLSGAVYGAAMNHRGALASLGDAVHQAPYKAPPTGVVLYIKPRNTFIDPGGTAWVDDTAPELEIGVALGVVVGRTACALREANALDHVAGYLVVADFSVPHDSFFRPQIRFKARDASCAFGTVVVPRGDIDDPDALAMHVFVDGQRVQDTTTGDRIRSTARLLADVSDFMTLNPGDVLLTGLSPGAPRAGAGAEVAVEIDGVGRLQVRLARSERAA